MIALETSAALDPLLGAAEIEARRTAIAEALAGRRSGTHFVRAPAGYLELPIVSVGHDALVYRADNGRILSELAGHFRRAQIAAEAFKACATEPAMQRLLHGLLIEKARDEEGPIFTEFEQNRQQTEPLLVTHDGLVINGNRRLSSMRELLARDASRYSAFARISVAVLPSELSVQDIEYIEAALQMAPELKLDYGWVNRRLKLREHVRDLPREMIMRAYRFAEPGEIERELGELELAETYLAFVGTPHDYEQIADAEEPFVALFEQLQAIPQPGLRELWTYAGFAMAGVRNKLERQILHYFPFTAPVPAEARDWVMRAFAEDKGLIERQPFEENRPVDSLLATRLRAHLSNPAASAEIAEHIVTLEDTFAVRHDKILGPFRAIANLRAARDNLVATSAHELPSLHLRQLRAEVASIVYIMDSLEAAAGAGSAAHGEAPLILPHPSWGAEAANREGGAPLNLIDIVRLAPHAFRDRLGRIHIPAGESGHAIYGPYLKPFPGAFRAKIALSAPAKGIWTRLRACHLVVDVVIDAGTVLARQDLRLRADGKASAMLTFTVPAALAADARMGLEVRVATDGRLACVVEALGLERVEDRPA